MDAITYLLENLERQERQRQNGAMSNANNPPGQPTYNTAPLNADPRWSPVGFVVGDGDLGVTESSYTASCMAPAGAPCSAAPVQMANSRRDSFDEDHANDADGQRELQRFQEELRGFSNDWEQTSSESFYFLIH